MDFIINVFDQAIILWKKGTFLATKVDRRRISLYSYNSKYYIIWYTDNNLLEKIGRVDENTAHQIFKHF